MIIDAMDILYTKNVDGFCIVSSDSDFTRLAARLRESRMFVIGMGESKTPTAFKSACDTFKYLDVLMGMKKETLPVAVSEKASSSRPSSRKPRRSRPSPLSQKAAGKRVRSRSRKRNGARSRRACGAASRRGAGRRVRLFGRDRSKNPRDRRARLRRGRLYAAFPGGRDALAYLRGL